MSKEKLVIVSNQLELRAALNTRTADTVIVLKEGNYGQVNFNAKDSPIGIKLVAADASKPPVFGALTISNANGVSVEGVTFKPLPEARFANGLTLRGCEDIVVKGNKFVGDAGAMLTQQRGLFIDKSSDVTIVDNDFAGLMRGGVVANSSGVKVVGNDVTNMRAEGFNFTAVKNVEIAHNKMSDFRPMAGDHPDFIQFWTSNAKTASENIHIHHNQLIQKDGGLSVQGIFMDNDDSIPYRNVVIEHNIIQTSMPRGILVEEGVSVKVANNIALAVDGSRFKVSISVTESKGVLVADNVTNAIILTDSISATEQSNTIVSRQVSGDRPLSVTDLKSLRAESAVINGTDGADRLNGTNRDDVIVGGAGADSLSGGRGDDVLVGGSGDNLLTGGQGADRFVFDVGSVSGRQVDRIFDFSFADGDRLELSNFGGALNGGVTTARGSVGGPVSTLVLDSASDFVELGRLNAVEITRRGSTDTLVMRITDQQSDVLEIQISNVFGQFLAAGGQIG